MGSKESLRHEGVAKLRDEIHERLVRFCEEELVSDPPGKDDIPEIRIVDGPCTPVILEEAKAVTADLFVMGTHGHSAIGEIVLGSVA